MNNANINFGLRLKHARLAQKMSMETLSERLNGKVSKQAISKYETGKMSPSMSLISELARVLCVELDYFFRPVTIDYETIEMSFRKKSSLGAKDAVALTIKIRNDIERFVEISEILGLNTTKPIHVEVKCPITENSQMEMFAKKLREDWGLGCQPIVCVGDLLESKGIIVLHENGPEGFDGASSEINSSNYVVVLNSNIDSTERMRFTALHELAHLLFNKYFSEGLSNLEKEKLCHAFASEMLLPSSVLMDNFNGKDKIALQEFVFIQEQYGISIDAIVYKLYQLKLFSDKRFRSYQMRKNSDPKLKEDITKSRFSETETPRFATMVYKALAANLISVSKASAFLKESETKILNNFAFL